MASLETFKTKRAIYKETREKSKDGKEVTKKVKTGDTAEIELDLPDFCQTPDAFLKTFVKLADVKMLMEQHWKAGETVKLQSYLRMSVKPEDWNAANLQAAIKKYTPQKQTRGKSQEQKLAEKYGMDESALKALLAKHGGK